MTIADHAVNGSPVVAPLVITPAARTPNPVKVALLRPPLVVLLKSLPLFGPMPSVGLAYIAGALREAGHDLQVIDALAEDMEHLEEFEGPVGGVRRIGLPPKDMVERIDPDTKVIGITHMFAHEWPTVRELAEVARARFPDVTIVIGGENATSFWPWIFEQTDAVDCCVLGEGEATVVELVARIGEGLPYAGMAGVAVREGAEGLPLDGGLPVRFKKLEGIPRPAWDLFPMDAFFRYRSFLGVDRGRSMPILATRGCPYKCSFCSSPNMWTTRYVVREPDDVADEIADYVERYGIRNVDFVDLTPITKRNWVLRLCDALEARNLDVSLQLPIGTRSEALDEQVLQRLYDAGCRNITFAPETGSERMLEVYDKRADLGHILDSIRAADKAGLVTNIHMIVGHPDERWHDRWLSWKFMIRATFAGLTSAGTTQFYPYPGSADFHRLVDEGTLRIDDRYCYEALCRGGVSSQKWNKNASPRLLRLTQVFMIGSTLVLRHLLHPKQVLHLIRTVLFGGEEQTWLEQGIATRRRGPLSTKARGMAVVHPDEVDPVGAGPESGESALAGARRT